MVAVLDILEEIPKASTSDQRRQLFDRTGNEITANVNRAPLYEVKADKPTPSNKTKVLSDNPASHEYQNNLTLEAQVGWSSATNTAGAVFKKNEEKGNLTKVIYNASAFAQAVGYDNNIKDNPHLKGKTLEDAHISKDNILMVHGDGPNSDLREATLDEKLQLEHQSGACSIAMTREELDMQAYLNGEIDQIPDRLHQIAEENGYLAEDLSQDEFENLMSKELSADPHITARITSPLLDGANLLPPQASISTPALTM